jgi:hypothetical protein
MTKRQPLFTCFGLCAMQIYFTKDPASIFQGSGFLCLSLISLLHTPSGPTNHKSLLMWFPSLPSPHPQLAPRNQTPRSNLVSLLFPWSHISCSKNTPCTTACLITTESWQESCTLLCNVSVFSHPCCSSELLQLAL